LAGERRWRESNRNHDNASKLAWAKRNPDKVQAMNRAWIARPAVAARNRVRNRVRMAVWRTDNVEAAREQDRQWRRRARQADPAGVSRRQRDNYLRWRAKDPEKARDVMNAAARRRRARRAGVPSEPWTTREICERDGWICQLCGDPIDPATPWLDALSGTADHIQPLAAGGPDLKTNLQAAHLACNAAKGDRWEDPGAPKVAC